MELKFMERSVLYIKLLCDGKKKKYKLTMVTAAMKSFLDKYYEPDGEAPRKKFKNSTSDLIRNSLLNK